MLELWAREPWSSKGLKRSRRSRVCSWSSVPPEFQAGEHRWLQWELKTQQNLVVRTETQLLGDRQPDSGFPNRGAGAVSQSPGPDFAPRLQSLLQFPGRFTSALLPGLHNSLAISPSSGTRTLRPKGRDWLARQPSTSGCRSAPFCRTSAVCTAARLPPSGSLQSRETETPRTQATAAPCSGRRGLTGQPLLTFTAGLFFPSTHALCGTMDPPGALPCQHSQHSQTSPPSPGGRST